MNRCLPLSRHTPPTAADVTAAWAAGDEALALAMEAELAQEQGPTSSPHARVAPTTPPRTPTATTIAARSSCPATNSRAAPSPMATAAAAAAATSVAAAAVADAAVAMAAAAVESARTAAAAASAEEEEEAQRHGQQQVQAQAAAPQPPVLAEARTEVETQDQAQDLAQAKAPAKAQGKARAQPQAQASRKRQSTTSTATVHAKAKEAAAETGVYDIGHLAAARESNRKWFYLVQWVGYPEEARTWEAQATVLEGGSDELRAEAAALREAVKAGTAPQLAPLAPGAVGWLGGLSTKGGRQWLGKDGGVRVRFVALEKGGERAVARKLLVQVLDGPQKGQTVRAWPRQVWPVASTCTTAEEAYDSDEVGSLHEPSPPPSPQNAGGSGDSGDGAEGGGGEAQRGELSANGQADAASGAANSGEAQAASSSVEPSASSSAAPPASPHRKDAVGAPQCVACPAEGCGTSFELDVTLPSWEAEHRRAKAAGTHMRHAVYGHDCSHPGFCHERAAELRLMSCPWCNDWHPGTASQAGFEKKKQKYCGLFGHMKKCRNRNGRTPGPDFMDACARQPSGRRWIAAEPARLTECRTDLAGARTAPPAHCSAPRSPVSGRHHPYAHPRPATAPPVRKASFSGRVPSYRKKKPDSALHAAPESVYEREHWRRGAENRRGAEEAAERAQAAWRARKVSETAAEEGAVETAAALELEAEAASPVEAAVVAVEEATAGGATEATVETAATATPFLQSRTRYPALVGSTAFHCTQTALSGRT